MNDYDEDKKKMNHELCLLQLEEAKVQLEIRRTDLDIRKEELRGLKINNDAIEKGERL